MAIRGDAAGDYLARSSDMPTTDPMTWCAWVYLTTDTNALATIFLVVNATGTQYQTVRLSSADGTTLQVANQSTSASGTSLATGTWYHIAYTRNGATHIVYLNGAQDSTISSNNALTPANILLLSNTANPLNGRVAAVKLWSGVALSAAEIANEMRTIRPQRLDSLHGWWPCFPGAGERARDYSGNGRNWTEGGTLTDEDGPPLPWGAAPLLVPYVAAAAGTYTGEGTPSLPALTAAGSGTFTVPTYGGAGAPSLAALTASGSGTFTVPTYDGTGAPSLPALTASGSGTFVAPSYTGEGAVSLPALTAAGTGLFATAVYSGTGAPSLPALTAAGSGTFAVPTYTGEGAPALPALAASGSGTFAAPTYTGEGAATLPALTAAGSGTFATQLFAGTGAATLPALTAAGAGTFAVPVYAGSGAVALPALAAAGTGTHIAPAYTGSGAVALAALTASGAGTFSETGFDPIANPSGAWGEGQSGAWSGGRAGAWSEDRKGTWG